MTSASGDRLQTTRLISAATVNATLVKDAPGQVYGVWVSNVNAAVRFLKLYDLAIAPTVGTTVPTHTFMIPAAGILRENWPNGIEFTAGIGFGTTTLVADADTNAISAAESVIHIFWR